MDVIFQIRLLVKPFVRGFTQVVHVGLETLVKLVVFACPQRRLCRLHLLQGSREFTYDNHKALRTYLCPDGGCVKTKNSGVGDGLFEARTRSAVPLPSTSDNAHFASVISSPASARLSLMASAPYFLVASLIVKKFPVDFDIFFPFNMR